MEKKGRIRGEEERKEGEGGSFQKDKRGRKDTVYLYTSKKRKAAPVLPTIAVLGRLLEDKKKIILIIIIINITGLVRAWKISCRLETN